MNDKPIEVKMETILLKVFYTNCPHCKKYLEFKKPEIASSFSQKSQILECSYCNEQFQITDYITDKVLIDRQFFEWMIEEITTTKIMLTGH